MSKDGRSNDVKLGLAKLWVKENKPWAYPLSIRTQVRDLIGSRFQTKYPTACAAFDEDEPVIYLNMKWMEELETEEFLFVYVHELTHIAGNHVIRMMKQKGSHQKKNYALDVFVNLYVEESGKNIRATSIVPLKPRMPIFGPDGKPAEWCYDKTKRTMAPEEILKEIVDDNVEIEQDERVQPGGSTSGQGDIGDETGQDSSQDGDSDQEDGDGNSKGKNGEKSKKKSSLGAGDSAEEGDHEDDADADDESGAGGGNGDKEPDQDNADTTAGDSGANDGKAADGSSGQKPDKDKDANAEAEDGEAGDSGSADDKKAKSSKASTESTDAGDEEIDSGKVFINGKFVGRIFGSQVGEPNKKVAEKIEQSLRQGEELERRYGSSTASLDGPSDYFVTTIEALRNVRPGLKEVLHGFMREAVTKHPEREWRGAKIDNTKYMSSGMIVPPRVRPEEQLADAVVAIDTSCSIDRQSLTNMVSVCIDMIKGTELENVVFIMHDNRIRRILKVQSTDEVDKIVRAIQNVYGGGGTNFDIVLRYVRENLKNCQVMVHFTDLLPAFWPPAPKYPVVFVVPSKAHADAVKPPYGIVYTPTFDTSFQSEM